MRSTITWQQQKNELRHIPGMLKLLRYQLIDISLRGNTSVLATVQVGGCNRTQTCNNTKGSNPNKIYGGGLNNLES